MEIKEVPLTAMIDPSLMTAIQVRSKETGIKIKVMVERAMRAYLSKGGKKCMR